MSIKVVLVESPPIEVMPKFRGGASNAVEIVVVAKPPLLKTGVVGSYDVGLTQGQSCYLLVP